jgi:DNA-binding FadR family transcriptional regulator
MPSLFEYTRAQVESSPKRAEVLAAEIQAVIRDRGWQVGEVLGGEPDLLDQFQVSRAILREAVRLLEHSGVARMRRGPGGGLVVTKPRADAVAASVATYLDFEGIDASQLFEARTALELQSVEVAAQRISEEGIRRLRAQLAREEELARSGDYDASEFHLLTAELAGNPALHLFIDVLAKLTVERSELVGGPAEHRNKEAGERMHLAHVAIADALIARDAALARHRMSRHLEAVSPWLRDHSPGAGAQG